MELGIAVQATTKCRNIRPKNTDAIYIKSYIRLLFFTELCRNCYVHILVQFEDAETIRYPVCLYPIMIYKEESNLSSSVICDR